jgi:hypothetical protein
MQFPPVKIVNINPKQFQQELPASIPKVRKDSGMQHIALASEFYLAPIRKENKSCFPDSSAYNARLAAMFVQRWFIVF